VNPLEMFLTIQAIPESDSSILRPVVTVNMIDANKGGLAPPASNYKNKDSPHRGEKKGLLSKLRSFYGVRKFPCTNETRFCCFVNILFLLKIMSEKELVCERIDINPYSEDTAAFWYRFPSSQCRYIAIPFFVIKFVQNYHTQK